MRPVATLASFATLALLAGPWGSPVTARAQQPAPDLVAPVYPGSVVVEVLEDENLPDGTRAFLSRDPIDAVKRFYERESGPMERASLSDLGVPDELRDESFGTRPFVFARRVEGGHRDLRGVQVSAREPREGAGAPSVYPAVGPIFQRLQMGMLNNEAPQARFDELVEEYRHLAWRYYPVSDEEAQSGERLTTDEVVVRRCEERAGGGRSSADLQAEMEALTRSGRFEEAAALGERLMGAAGSSSWDVWVECLKRLEEVGYRTLILIHERTG